MSLIELATVRGILRLALSGGDFEADHGTR